MTDDELTEYFVKAGPALERHVHIKSRYSLSREDVEDVVQDTLLRFIRNLSDSFIEQTPPSEWMPYLYRISDNLLIDRWRAKKPTEPLDFVNLPDNNLVDVTEQISLRRALLVLTELEQDVIAMIAMGYTQEQIAKEHLVPTTTAAFWVRTAKHKLREFLGQSGMLKKG